MLFNADCQTTLVSSTAQHHSFSANNTSHFCFTDTFVLADILIINSNMFQYGCTKILRLYKRKKKKGIPVYENKYDHIRVTRIMHTSYPRGKHSMKDATYETFFCNQPSPPFLPHSS
uniref:Uncharacterized protein n=1 Tax=Parascaris univalens TaxID=6257 RepID=A0A915CFW7_PARUN